MWIPSDNFWLKTRCSCNHKFDHSTIQLRSNSSNCSFTPWQSSFGLQREQSTWKASNTILNTSYCTGLAWVNLWLPILLAHHVSSLCLFLPDLISGRIWETAIPMGSSFKVNEVPVDAANCLNYHELQKWCRTTNSAKNQVLSF